MAWHWFDTKLWYIVGVITVTSHERHKFSNDWQLDCFFNSLFRRISGAGITAAVWYRSKPLHQRQQSALGAGIKDSDK